MSEFQLSLLSIGFIVIAGVFLYGQWQQWRYRRSMGKPLAEPPAEVMHHVQPVENISADINDPLKYHLVINTSLMGYDNAARLIGDAVLRLPA